MYVRSLRRQVGDVMYTYRIRFAVSMRTQRFYLTFCLVILTFTGCFWYAAYPSGTLESLAGIAQHAGAAPFQTSGSSRQATLLHQWTRQTVEPCPMKPLVKVPSNLSDPCSDEAAKNFLTSHLLGPYYCPLTEATFAKRQMIFNTVWQIKPKIVITPMNIDDIRLSLQLAQQQNWSVVVKDGGHNPAGFGIIQDGMVINMAYFRDVRFANERTGDVCRDAWMKDAPPDSIVAQGGSTWSQIHPLIEDRGLEIVGGGCPSVGVVGLALGGGVGWTSRRYGLVSDNVLGLRIVMPDGTLKIVDDEHDPDLFWALRGAGGSNFGVVTDVLLRTFPAYDRYLAGFFDIIR